MRQGTLARAAGMGALVAGAMLLRAPTVTAADHSDAPSVSTIANRSADIADFYAWHEPDDENIVVVLTFAAGLPADDYPVYDPQVLYSIHIDNTATQANLTDPFDNDNDNLEDISIHVRLGTNDLGEWFIQVLNLPGADGDVVGPVGEAVGEDGGARVMLATFDDPFFFDLDGFEDTVANVANTTGTSDIAFAGLTGTPVDTLAGTNVMAIVMEIPAADVLDGNADNVVQLWATTGRVPR